MARLDRNGQAPRAARDIEADPDEHTRGPVPAQRCGPGGAAAGREWQETEEDRNDRKIT